MVASPQRCLSRTHPGHGLFDLFRGRSRGPGSPLRPASLLLRHHQRILLVADGAQAGRELVLELLLATEIPAKKEKCQRHLATQLP